MKQSEQGVEGHFHALRALLAEQSASSLTHARNRLAGLTRGQLVSAFRIAWSNGLRVISWLLAAELVTRGVPPFAWHAQTPRAADVNSRFDLLVFDVMWLRHAYPEHHKRVRYQRYQNLFVATDRTLHFGLEYVYHSGQRPMWKIIASLSLSESQQWDCTILRSVPIKRRDVWTRTMAPKIRQALSDDLARDRTERATSKQRLEQALERRCCLWLCARMTRGSAAAMAVRFEQLTGQEISRQNAWKQLEKVRKAVTGAGLAFTL